MVILLLLSGLGPFTTNYGDIKYKFPHIKIPKCKQDWFSKLKYGYYFVIRGLSIKIYPAPIIFSPTITQPMKSWVIIN